MKKHIRLLILSIPIALISCNPKVSTSLSRHYPALDYEQEVIVFGLNQQEPEGLEYLGELKIGDTGFSANCGYDVVIEKAKLETRKAGGNVIKIIKHKPPTAMGSSCHRITARILRAKDIKSLRIEEEKEDLLDVDYAILNVYRYGGAGGLVSYDLNLGDSVICRVKNNYKTTIHLKKEGYNSLWARTESKEEVPIDVVHGKTYYLRCGISMGIMVGRPKMVLVNPKTGASEFDSFQAKNK